MKTPRSDELGLAKLLLMFAIASIVVSCDSKESAASGNQNIGNTLILAIDRYKQETGAYPAELSSLMPKYVKKIQHPRNCSGNWMYELEENGTEFALGFRGSGDHHTGWYNSKTGEWWIDSK